MEFLFLIGVAIIAIYQFQELRALLPNGFFKEERDTVTLIGLACLLIYGFQAGVFSGGGYSGRY